MMTIVYSTLKTQLATESTEITEEKQTVITKLRFTFWVSQQNEEKPLLSLCSLCSLWLELRFLGST